MTQPSLEPNLRLVSQDSLAVASVTSKPSPAADEGKPISTDSSSFFIANSFVEKESLCAGLWDGGAPRAQGPPSKAAGGPGPQGFVPGLLIRNAKSVGGAVSPSTRLTLAVLEGEGRAH